MESSTQLASSYVRDFSVKARVYRNTKSQDALANLNRATSLLTTISFNHFDDLDLEISRFFIDLHTVMADIPTEADALWACVTLLQHCSRNLEARRRIVDDFRFLPLLGFVLSRTNAQDKATRLLTLIQDLTFGIVLYWEEPYIGVLLEHLVGIVYSTVEDGDETNSLLALSVLINLCQNFVVKFLFLRSTCMSVFSRKIENYGMLASKMLIILSEDMNAPKEKQLHLFLHSTFASICDCIKEWNVPCLRHIVEFLINSKSYPALYSAMRTYDSYCNNVEKMLNQLEVRCKMNDSDNDKTKQQQISIGLIFQLMQYILQLSSICNTDGSENVISLDSNVPRLYDVVSDWLDSKVCGADANQLLDSLINLAKKDTLASRIAREPSFIVKLVAISNNNESSGLHIAAILQLMLTLLRHVKTKTLILSTITVQYFKNILEPLLSYNSEMPAALDVEKYTFCLLLLANFASIAKGAYVQLNCDILAEHAVHYALARALLSGNEGLCNAVFEISQFNNFPQSHVSQQLCILSSNKPGVKRPNATNDHWRDVNAVLKYNKTFVSKEVEQRLQALVEVIFEANKKNQLGNVATSQIIELFNYKIEQFQCVEDSMQKRLEQASHEITNLAHRNNLQNTELQKYQTMNFELHINMESLQTQCKDLKEQKDSIKGNMTEQMKLLSEQKKSLFLTEKQLAVKSVEMLTLEREHQTIKEQLTGELEKLRHNSKENMMRIEKFKNSITAYELDIKEKQHCIDDRERNLADLQKSLDEQREATKKSDDVIAVLESQLQEKKEIIHNYELELNESEQVRKAIMSLMGNKKAKRADN